MSDWKSSMGLSEDTSLVKLYPPESHPLPHSSLKRVPK